MTNKKKDLAKVAVAALLLAASLPAASHADEVESQGILLAGGGCGASPQGCGAASSRSGCGAAAPSSGSYETSNPYNRPAGRPGNTYDSTSGTYGGSSGYHSGAGSSSGWGAGSMSSENYNSGSPSYSPNANRPGSYVSEEYMANPGNPNAPQTQRGNPNNPNNPNRNR